MERPYDIFERTSAGSFVSRGSVAGYEEAVHKLHRIAAQTTNEVRLTNGATKAIVAELNPPATDSLSFDWQNTRTALPELVAGRSGRMPQDPIDQSSGLGLVGSH